MASNLDYKQVRCPHGWPEAEVSQCDPCSLVDGRNRETGLRIEAEAMLAASKAEIARLEMELDWYRAFYLSHVSKPHGVA